VGDSNLVEYRIELSATFDVDITSSVLGSPGLDRAGVEELIEKDWMWISADKHILQESSWELTAFHEKEPIQSRSDAPHIGESSDAIVIGMDSIAERAWVVLVTRGATVDCPPEIYRSMGRAVFEAERWASTLSSGDVEVERPFDGRWRVGEHDVRLVEIDWMVVDAPWVGTFWDRSGNPDPEALLLQDRQDALAWVMRPPMPGLEPHAVVQEPWRVSATHLVRDEEVSSDAQLAKLVN